MLAKKVCPKCGSDDVVVLSKGSMNVWKCRNCGFVGNMIDKPIVGKEIGEKKR